MEILLSESSKQIIINFGKISPAKAIENRNKSLDPIATREQERNAAIESFVINRQLDHV